MGRRGLHQPPASKRVRGRGAHPLPPLQTLDALDEMLKVLVFESQASCLQRLQNILQVCCLQRVRGAVAGLLAPRKGKPPSRVKGPALPGTRHREHAVGWGPPLCGEAGRGPAMLLAEPAVSPGGSQSPFPRQHHGGGQPCPLPLGPSPQKAFPCTKAVEGVWREEGTQGPFWKRAWKAAEASALPGA